MVNILNQQNTILCRFMAELRDQDIQKDALRFRFNMERLGQVMAYEVSKKLSYTKRDVVTPLGQSPTMLPEEQIVLATILRAGVPMMNGFLNFFDHAEVAFVSARRHYRKNGQMEITMQQITTPSLENKVLILIDPMLATGVSSEMAYRALIEQGGMPIHTHICAAISSTDGIEYMESHLRATDVTLWSVEVDSDMTVKSYIVPGIGDAGDLSYGEKL
ncbi:MAG: uracil phosphoribosyltransferase [Mucinivorans sp.]